MLHASMNDTRPLDRLSISQCALFLALLLVAGCQAAAPVREDLSSNPAYVEAKRVHAQLFDHAADTYQAVWRKQVNDGKPRLHELIFAGGKQGEPIAVDGSVTIPIPEDLWALRRQFELLAFRGDVGNIHLTYQPSNGRRLYEKMTGKSRVAVMTRDLKPKPNHAGGYRLVITGKGRIDSIGLWQRRGLNPEFDDSIYRTAGLDKPIASITVTFDPSCYQAIEGSYAFEPRKWLRYYTAPFADQSGFEPWYRQRGFYPGRQMLKFRPAFEIGYGPVIEKNPLREDPNRPGYIPRGYFDEVLPDERALYDQVDYRWAMCFNNWPSFQSAAHPTIENKKGTPKKPYEAAADTVVQYLNSEIKARGKTAYWWEVKNESDVQSEWMWHWHKDYDGWKMLAEFHNAVADAVHKNVKQKVMVCGPTSAHFHPERGSFGNWRDQRRFMDLTKGRLDALSHHFYDSPQLNSYQKYRAGTYSGFLQGKLHGTLDMVRAHQHAIDDVKPIIISEYGVLSGGGRDVDYWRKIKTCSSMLIQLMQRPEDLDLAVPFILPYMHWDPDSDDHMAKRIDGEFQHLKLVYFVKLWRNLSGSRIVATSPDKRLTAIGLREGHRVTLILNNITDQIHDVALQAVAGRVKRAWRRQCSYRGGKLSFEDRMAIDPRRPCASASKKPPYSPSRSITPHPLPPAIGKVSTPVVPPCPPASRRRSPSTATRSILPR
jgi:hypothetical protein